MSFIKRRFAAFLFSCCVLFIAAVKGAVLPGAVSADTFRIAAGGEAKSVVVVSGEATPVELHAAEELSYFLGKVTGAPIRVSNEPVRGKYALWLGTHLTNPAVGRKRLEPAVKSLSDHGFLLRSDRDGLVIAGREPLGVLFGTYAFLEEHVGMRWFHPGEEGEHCPSIPDLRIPRISVEQNPSFPMRDVAFSTMAVTSEIPETWDWVARNRMLFRADAGRVYDMHREEHEKRGAYVRGGGHVLHRMVPDELFEEHPEYFGLYDGERRKQMGHRGQPCTSHPEVVNLAAEYMLAWFRENPEGVFTINNNDWPRFCECDNCTALDPPGEIQRPAGTLSTRFFTFKNEVAERVWEVYPGARINTLAYQNFRLPPTAMVPDGRLWVQICDQTRCFRHSIDDESCEANEFARELFSSWADAGGGAVLRNNYPYTPARFPLPLERIAAADLIYMHRLGHKWFNMRLIPPDGRYREDRDVWEVRNAWRMNFPRFYVQAKLAWDADLDFDELMLDLAEKYYGPAAGAMKRYRELLARLWEDAPGHFVRHGYTRLMAGSATAAPNAMRDLDALLAEAAKAASGNSLYEARVAKDREIFDKWWVETHRMYSERPAVDIQAARRLSEITIDGILDEKDWQDLERVTNFVRRGAGGELAEVQTYVRLLYDDNYLYAALEMEEPALDELSMEADERDSSAVFRDDTVELFIDPDGEGLSYVHIAVNPAGVFRDSLCMLGMPPSGDVSFDTGAEVAARVREGGWTVELRVSAESLGGEIRDGGRWTMNVGRARRAGEGEVSSWSDGAFHSPESFPGVVFGQPLIRNGRFDDIIVMDTDALFRRHGSGRWEYGNEPPMIPRHWRLGGAYTGSITVISDAVYAGDYAVRIEHEGASFAAFAQDIDAEVKGGQKLLVSFAARGSADLSVTAWVYGRDPETGRRRHEGSRGIGSVQTGGDWQRHELVYVHAEDDPGDVRLAFYVREGLADIDDVYVVPAPE